MKEERSEDKKKRHLARKSLRTDINKRATLSFLQASNMTISKTGLMISKVNVLKLKPPMVKLTIKLLKIGCLLNLSNRWLSHLM